jgi:hypothetical protein
MPLIAAVGQVQALDGREAGLQATHQALNRLGNNPVALGIVISPYHYDVQQVVNGITGLLGNAPLIGFSTTAGLTNAGQHPQSVVVALIGGGGMQAETHWFPEYAQSGQDTANKLKQLLNYEHSPAEGVLVFTDGFNGEAEQLCAAIPAQIPLVGGLASGNIHSGFSYQLAGNQSGAGCMCAAFLRGNLKMGIGFGHGWNPVGNRTRVTRSRGFWLRTLDGRPASETYAHMFGYPAREWAYPPLNHLTRLYPLGLEQGTGTDLLIRAPLRVEADGSFRMNATLRDGSDAYLLVGSPTGCTQAAQHAAKQALFALGKAKPVFALVLVDQAWQMLLQARPGMEVAAVQEVLGAEVPIAGGYTLGQIVPGTPPAQTAHFLNQHLVVVTFGTVD